MILGQGTRFPYASTKSCRAAIRILHAATRDSLVVQWQRIRLPMQETWVPSLGWEDPLEKEMATHSNIPAWEIPRGPSWATVYSVTESNMTL